MTSSNIDLLPEQETAALHTGTHARLLAGPGTGKTLTLTHRVINLIEREGVPANQILVLTFTRAAAAELRERILGELPEDMERPYISTLHSFALRQLVKNSNLVDPLPQPIRVADDWEERNLIYDQLKLELIYSVKDIRERFNQLSADWETLAADESDWSDRFIDPTFLGAWEEQRMVLGYTLRSELVYQVKRALEQSGNFELESDFAHMLVDEYQDLNKCDLAVIRSIAERGCEQFAAGDDDQSIYGFRMAHPDGIRNFGNDYDQSQLLSLSTCMRCDKRIIRLAEFVADQDPRRLEKELVPRLDAGTGEVAILRFPNQYGEAQGIALLCQTLVAEEKIAPEDILILLRSDHNQVYSNLIADSLRNNDLPVSSQVADPLDTDEGRTLKAIVASSG